MSGSNSPIRFEYFPSYYGSCVAIYGGQRALAWLLDGRFLVLPATVGGATGRIAGWKRVQHGGER